MKANRNSHMAFSSLHVYSALAIVPESYGVTYEDKNEWKRSCGMNKPLYLS